MRLHLIVEYLLVSIFLYHVIQSRYAKITLVFFAPIFLIINIYDYLKFGNLSFGNIPTLIEFLIFIVFIIIYLFEWMQNNSYVPIYNTMTFWICVGLFVYFTGNFFYILLVENSTNASLELKNQLKIIYCIVTIIKNLLLSFSLLANERSNDDNGHIPFPQELDLDAITPNKNIN